MGIIPNRIAVVLSTGRVEKFVVDKRTIWKNQIERCLQNIDPKSVDADEPIFDKKGGVLDVLTHLAFMLCISILVLFVLCLVKPPEGLKELKEIMHSNILSILGRKDVYVQDNDIYFRGENITNAKKPTNEPLQFGDLISSYDNPIFMEKLGIVVFIQSTEEYLGEEYTYRADMSGIWAYSITQKIKEKIIPGSDYRYISNLRKVGKSNFCFVQSGNGYCNSEVYGYSLIDWQRNYIHQGNLIDVIDKGEYKDCILVHSNCMRYERPCTDAYGARLIVDMQGKVQGCLCYGDWQEEFECRNIDYNNIQFVAPPRCK
jgi:hypothetical protein